MLDGACEISALYLCERVRVKADGATNMEMVRFGGQLVYRNRERVLWAGKVTRQEEWSVDTSQ
jgi:hypothetical protein